MDLEKPPADQAAGPASSGSRRALPPDAIAIVPVRNMVLFPGMVLPLALTREPSVLAAQEALRAQAPIGILLQRSPEVEQPAAADMHEIGVAAAVLRYLTAQDGTHHVICQGQQRIRILEMLEGWPFMVARVEHLAEPEASGPALEARLHQLKQRALEAVELLPNAPPELAPSIRSIDSAGMLADIVAGMMELKPDEKQKVLETLDVAARVDIVLGLLAYRIEVLRLSRDIGQQTQQAMEGRQRDFVLREQMRAIQKELGEEDGRSVEIADLEAAIAKAGMPEEAERQARRELKRLERMPEGASEYGMVRAYLDWLIELPWSIASQAPIDIAQARRVLDDDHFGLPKVKRRILEHLSVRKLNPHGRSPILCFVGPPGVGKTSLGQSIARATGRRFARISLGGTHDEAEIRGHRRTYIGAMPGNIIQAIRRAGARDCVLMLDEIDKVSGGSVQGDPAAAMLEVLDPEQNATFRDNYLGVPFDLSQILFIATANMLESIPGPLRDRMEVIQLSGYTEAEKAEIARRYLVERQRTAAGVTAEQCEVTGAALAAIIRDYTREAGVRNLEREIGAVFRHCAMRIAEGETEAIRIGPDELAGILGPPRYEREVALRTSVPGVSTGLAWTPVGGEILFIEATRTPGGGKLILTGQLGEVMRESAQAAMSLIKTRLPMLGLAEDAFDRADVHIHVPAGATPKDGPSAGVAMFMALASMMTGRTVRSDTAMTGEISLRGLVLPVGGIREKVIAAMRAGITTVLLPARNRKDLEDIPEDVRQAMRVVWLESVDQAVEEALEPVSPGADRPQ